MALEKQWQLKRGKSSHRPGGGAELGRKAYKFEQGVYEQLLLNATDKVQANQNTNSESSV
jgi:hypothetical protein